MAAVLEKPDYEELSSPAPLSTLHFFLLGIWGTIGKCKRAALIGDFIPKNARALLSISSQCHTRGR